MTALTQTPALDLPAVTATDILRTLRAHGMEPSTVQQTHSGDFSIKFVGGNGRWWARRIIESLPDAQVVRWADGEVTLVVVKV